MVPLLLPACLAAVLRSRLGASLTTPTHTLTPDSHACNVLFSSARQIDFSLCTDAHIHMA